MHLMIRISVFFQETVMAACRPWADPAGAHIRTCVPCRGVARNLFWGYNFFFLGGGYKT